MLTQQEKVKPFGGLTFNLASLRAPSGGRFSISRFCRGVPVRIPTSRQINLWAVDWGPKVNRHAAQPPKWFNLTGRPRAPFTYIWGFAVSEPASGRPSPVQSTGLRSVPWTSDNTACNRTDLKERGTVLPFGLIPFLDVCVYLPFPFTIGRRDVYRLRL